MANGSLWSRLRGFFRRLFLRAPPEPGRFVAGAKWAWTGGISTVPWQLPRREYLVYVPRGWSRWRRRPLLVLIHGCRQTPEAFAAGTRIAALVDREGWLVLLPRQAPRANPWGCWNWFEHWTARGRGETAIVAAQIRKVRRRFRADPRRIVVAGMSSGGALAATLGVRRPRLFAGVFVHSGVACGAATSPLAAFGVLKSGPDADVERIGAEARADAGAQARLPVMTVQGDADDVVAPCNAARIVRQYLALDGRPAAFAGDRDALPADGLARETAGEDRQEVPGAAMPMGAVVDPRTTAAGSHATTTTEFRDGDRLLARHVVVHGLGHAWSGGDGALPFNDPRGPDATALLGEFVREATA
jgi:poly(hydroxyalkanoate) depolymerase family esterase